MQVRTLLGPLNEKGTKVRMTEGHKNVLLRNGNRYHVQEFGHCVGVVDGPTDYGSQQGPEVDVYWQPSDLRYAYLPENLEIV